MNTNDNCKKIRAAALTGIILVGTLSACNTETSEQTSQTSQTTLTPATMASELQSQAEEISVKDFELENKQITFLSSWTRNPVKGKSKDPALELFESKYGGKVVDMVVGQDERFDKLATLVAAGTSPDFFSAGDMDAFPMGAIKNMFQAVDDYIDYSDEWWSDAKSLNDRFLYKDKHYVAAISPEVEVVMIYNKEVVEENGLDDPFELLKAGNWNWDTCKQMMNKFCNNSDDHYATDGWWVSMGFINSTGVPLIGMEDGKVVNNVKNALIGEAEEFLGNLNKEGMAYPVWEHDWVAAPANVGLGKTLFFPVGYWALTETESEYGLVQYGKSGEIGFVPIPKCPSADVLYVPARINGYMLCSGAQNPEGFAALMYSEMAAASSEEGEQITKEQYFNDYGWTDDMWEMREVMYDLLNENPVFDFYRGVSQDTFDNLDNPSKDAYHNGTSWTQTRETIFGAIQSEVDKANGLL